MKRVLFAIVFISTLTFLSNAQLPFGNRPTSALSATKKQPVSWNARIEWGKASEGSIIITADITAGYHIYGPTASGKGGKPTTFKFSNIKGLKLIGSPKATIKPRKHFDSAFNTEVTWWEGKVTFIQRVKLVDNATQNAYAIDGTVDYMSCSEKTCNPPRQFTFTLKN